jgi:preprotein translocase subunit SecA
VSVLDKILRAGEGRQVRQLEKLAEVVNSFEAKVSALNDEDLRDQTRKFRERLANGETLDDLLPEAFATVREAAKRTLGQRHIPNSLIYVQLRLVLDSS